MTFEPSASQAQIDARQHAFDNQPDPATLVSREEIRAALLDRHTAATQDKLDAAHVAICGCGGLGSTIAVALTRIGVGHLHLIDFDRAAFLEAILPPAEQMTGDSENEEEGAEQE